MFRELSPKRFFVDVWAAIDNDPQREVARGPYDYRPLIVYAIGAVMLTLMEYFGHSENYWELTGWLRSKHITHGIFESNHRFHTLMPHVWWSLWRVLGYFVVPAWVVRVLFKEPMRSYGLQMPHGAFPKSLYVFFFVIVLVAVVVVSFSPHFHTYYPFYKDASRSVVDLVLWECMYAAQFFALEFFFRGFLLQACRRSMGSQAIFAMVVPYCMIHYGKPWLECLAAIIAGIVLGTLAMRTRSIMSGFLLHVGVAISMDVAALIQNDAFGHFRWIP